MILYLDASAFVKLYVNESDSNDVRAAVSESRTVYCHLIGYVEVRAGLAKACRMQRLADATNEYQLQQFERDWKNLDVVLLDFALARRAAELADRFGLRGYDSVHLAAAERVFETLPAGNPFIFAAFDKHLRAVAETLGIDILG